MKQRHTRVIVAALLLGLAISLGGGAARAQNSSRTGKRRVIELRSQKIVLPLGDRIFEGGDGAKIANTRCLLCHSKGMIDTQPALPMETWKKEVDKMRSAYGCPLRDDQVDGIVKFIFQANSTSPTGHQTTPNL